MKKYRVRIVNRMDNVLKAERAATVKNLTRAAGTVRITASRSIRRRRKEAPPSKPGETPKTPSGRLRRVIRYSVEKKKREATIGAVREIHTQPQSVWGLLEKGGIGRTRMKQVTKTTFQIGEFGPIESLGRGKAIRIRLTSAKQVDRAEQLAQQINQERDQENQIDRHYEARPFMRPALEKTAPQLPREWQHSVK